jgi:two-component system sensor histidine kinase ChvG
VPPRFSFGIRAQLGLAALALLALPWLAVQFVTRMETFLRGQQEATIGATARAIASALSDRPALFSKTIATDPEAEERRRIIAYFAGADPDAAASLGDAYVPSEEIERLLQIMGRRSSRMYVIDTRSLVRGLTGTIRETEPDEPGRLTSWLRPLAALVIPTPSVPVGDVSLPDRSQIDRALNGVVSTSWRGVASNPNRAILSAAQPIFLGDDIVGAVLVQETTDSIVLLRQSRLEDLLAVTLLVTAAALTILLTFATRLASRVARLHRQAEAAIDPQGRILGTITPTNAGDEIGDLTRTMSAVMERLRGYNAYLEAMAGRLSHELRTPVAVVRSSLDNLKAQKLPDDARVYVERAGEGVERLSRLISRLSEGTRLERMLESAERERFDLVPVVVGCVEGYRAAYAGRRFEVNVPAGPIVVRGVPDAFAQLLDKLAENAVDFAPPGSAIRVSFAADARSATLAVENDGPPLPDATRLFDSMVTLREPGGAGGEVHLGLGLFIVRLVAEFHGGRARARNLERGVRFEVEVPMAAQNP